MSPPVVMAMGNPSFTDDFLSYKPPFMGKDQFIGTPCHVIRPFFRLSSTLTNPPFGPSDPSATPHRVGGLAPTNA